MKDSFLHEVEANKASLVLHWDSKLLPDLTGKGDSMKVDRLPVLMSSPALEFEKLLAVPKLPLSSGAAMDKAIVPIIQEWKLEDCVTVLSWMTN